MYFPSSRQTKQIYKILRQSSSWAAFGQERTNTHQTYTYNKKKTHRNPISCVHTNGLVDLNNKGAATQSVNKSITSIYSCIYRRVDRNKFSSCTKALPLRHKIMLSRCWLWRWNLIACAMLSKQWQNGNVFIAYIQWLHFFDYTEFPD